MGVGRKPNRLVRPWTAISIAITTRIVNNNTIVQYNILVTQNNFPIGLSTDRGALHGMGRCSPRQRRKWDKVKERKVKLPDSKQLVVKVTLQKHGVL